MNKIFSIITIFVLAFPVFAEDTFVLPDQRIEGAEEAIPLGELINLTLSKITEYPKFLDVKGIMVDWKAYEYGKEKKYTKVSSDGSFSFGTGIVPKVVNVVAAVSYTYVVKDDKGVITSVFNRVVIKTVDVKCGEGPTPPPPGPGPGPGPIPPPGPEPVFPDGKFGLAKFSYQLAKAKVIAPTDRVNGAAAVASSMQSMVSAVAAGTINSLEDLLKKTAVSNDSALVAKGVLPSTWSAFGDDLQKNLYGLYKNNKLNAKDDFKAAWEEIIMGLKEVKS